MDASLSKTILVVDDAPANIRVLSDIIADEFNVIVATSGPEALELAASHATGYPPDLILLDIIMPEMDGYEVCRRLRNNPLTAETPIIFITASTDEKTLEKAFGAGGSDYVRKPVSRIELLTRIKSVLSRRELIQKRISEEKLQGVLEMAGGVCHELNQPLQAITGFVQLLALQTDPDDPRCEYIDIIKGQAERMAEITKKLMNITRYETIDYLGEIKIINIKKATENNDQT